MGFDEASSLSELLEGVLFILMKKILSSRVRYTHHNLE